ncbi:MAG: 5'-nucleotidase C-terminal domain-containing protein [Gramella sp.]|nr:5'-nucleotidase C-terminal domain-containing protein [Christiangramia sp.]
MEKIKFIVLIISAFIISCKGFDEGNTVVTEISTNRIQINNSIKEQQAIKEFIAPFKEHLNKTLDSSLAHNPVLLSKNDGDMNTALGNLMADALMIQANPIIKNRAGRDIDMVLLNHGGIRAELPQGEVTARSAYNLMPFENEIVVAELTGKQIKKMLKYLENAKSAHPVSGIKIIADKKYNIIESTIAGKKIEDEQTYFVATSDYLFHGGDNMDFFKDPVNLYHSDYKIRNALIDYFTKVDTIKAEIDDRYIRE